MQKTSAASPRPRPAGRFLIDDDAGIEARGHDAVAPAVTTALEHFRHKLPIVLTNHQELRRRHGPDCAIELDHLCRALILDALYQAAPPSYDSAGNLDLIAGHVIGMAMTEIESSPLVDRSSRDYALAMNKLKDFRPSLEDLAWQVDHLASREASPYAAMRLSNLALIVYEPVIRRQLAELGLDASNPWLASLFDKAGEPYATNMISAMRVVGQQLEQGMPMDTTQLIALHAPIASTGFHGASSTGQPGCSGVQFVYTRPRGMSDAGIAQLRASVQRFNRILAEAARDGGGQPDADEHAGEDLVQLCEKTGSRWEPGHPFAMSVSADGSKMCMGREPLDPDPHVAAGYARHLLDSLFADFHHAIHLITQSAVPEEQMMLHQARAVVTLVQDVLRAHLFSDGNGRLANILLLHRVVAELRSGGATLHPGERRVLMFDDMLIAMLSVDEAADQLRAIALADDLPEPAGPLHASLDTP